MATEEIYHHTRKKKLKETGAALHKIPCLNKRTSIAALHGTWHTIFINRPIININTIAPLQHTTVVNEQLQINQMCPWELLPSGQTHHTRLIKPAFHFVQTQFLFVQ